LEEWNREPGGGHGVWMDDRDGGWGQWCCN
jgi:hypothetical protein